MDRNQGKGVQLFIPGQTKLNDDDVFLGGPGTGVTDDMLGGGTRVFGDTAEGTAKAFDSFQKSNQSPFETNDIAAQIKAVTAANSAPRSDSYIGMPTGARLDMEQKQIQDAVTNAYNQNKFTYDKGQDSISNKYKQDTLDHTISQDNFTNEYNVGKMMANYKGQDTYEKTADAIKNAQFMANLNSNNYNDAENRKISQQNADNNELIAGITRTGGGMVSGGSMPQEYSGWINDAATKNGIPPNVLAGLIEAESSWNPTVVNPTSGATGLGQFLATTGNEEGVNRTDPKSSIYGAASYLAKRIKWAGGDLNKGIMGYGEGTPAYLDRVLGKAKNYTISPPIKTIGTKPADKINTNELIGRLNTMYTAKDSSSGEVTVNPNTKPQLRGAIIGQGLSDQETDELLLYYGLPINN